MKVRMRRAPLATLLAIGSIVLGFWPVPNVCAAGQGGGPAVTFSPASLTFGTEPLNTTSAPQAVMLTNTGNASLDITSVSIADRDFSETDNCAGASLAAGASCTIMVTFKPLLFGTRNATVVVADNASDSPQSVSLTGTGMGPAVTLSPTVLEFGNQLATTTSAAQTVTLTNSGDEPLTIASVTILGTFSESNDCPVSPSTLAVSGTCTFTVKFAPLAGGPAAGLIEITDDASPGPQAVSMSGVGADFSLAVSPSSNNVSPGQKATYTITATPVGGFNQAVSFTCSALPAAASCTFSPSSITLDGTNPGTASFTVNTTAASLAAPTRMRRPLPPATFTRLQITGLCLLLGSLAAWLAVRRRRARVAAAMGLLAAMIVAAAVMPACGGGGSSSSSVNGTPAGTYMVLVTGNVAGTSIANPASFTLVVQ